MKQILIGEIPSATFFGYVFFAALGVALSLLWHSSERNVTSAATPKEFSWTFLLVDNLKRIFVSVICVYAALRFTEPILNIKLTDFWAFAIGLSFDKLVEQIKKRTNVLDMPR